MDLEEITRRLLHMGLEQNDILNHLIKLGLSNEFSNALLQEIENCESLAGMNEEIKELIRFDPTGLQAGSAGLGSRGEGDFTIHHAIARLCSSASDSPGDKEIDHTSVKSTSLGDDGMGTPVITPIQQDDGGVIRTKNGDFIIVSVDGLHSRLGHWPFLAGFHVARACIRDVLVMGGNPIALFSDIHIGTNGDPASILEYTAGITTVGDTLKVPLIAGSTLRIGGDLVLGDRLSGAAGCIGLAAVITPRKNVEPGDVLIMTKGSGGGTISATAIFNEKGKVLEETLNLDFIKFTLKLLDSGIIPNIHALTDVTNGGIRGDLTEISTTAGVDIIFNPDIFLSLINPRVLKMLESLNIDPLGISIDSLLIICPRSEKEIVLEFISRNKMDGNVIGYVETTNVNRDGDPGGGRVFTEYGWSDSDRDFEDRQGSGQLKRIELTPLFRESPYTLIKSVVDKDHTNPDEVKLRIEKALERSEKKKQWMMRRL